MDVIVYDIYFDIIVFVVWIFCKGCDDFIMFFQILVWGGYWRRLFIICYNYVGVCKLEDLWGIYCSCVCYVRYWNFVW